MRTILLGIFLLLSTFCLAQRECASNEYLEVQKASQPSIQNELEAVENFIRQQRSPYRTLRTSYDDAQPPIIIPVVVHILYNNASQNISNEQVNSQVNALNRDFRRTNQDTSLTPQHFKSIAADVQIEFRLASVDPQGRATNGINRRSTSIAAFRTDDKIKFYHQGGIDAWDSRNYLNIWVGPMQSVIGYSSMPGTPADRDGIVIATSAFGTFNTSAPYHMGRTAVHEVGHWLGLKHIWGDQFCGDDHIDDTPSQGNFTPGCPTAFRSSCNNASTGDMYMNYMDYTSDACVNMFTYGQSERMRTLFLPGGPRNSILASKALGQPWNFTPAEENDHHLEVKLYPNPASHEIRLNLPKNWAGTLLRITDIWGNLQANVQVSGEQQKIHINQLKPGIYFITGVRNGEIIREKFIRL